MACKCIPHPSCNERVKPVPLQGVHYLLQDEEARKKGQENLLDLKRLRNNNCGFSEYIQIFNKDITSCLLYHTFQQATSSYHLAHTEQWIIFTSFYCDEFRKVFL